MKSTLLTIFITILIPLSSFASITEIFVVRHAEKQKGSDPSLTSKGQKRAKSLVHLQLAFQSNIEGIYTSTMKRTQETATPLAIALDIPIVKDIGATSFKEMVQDIIEQHSNKSVLIVGHTSTIPKLLEFLNPRAKKIRISSRNFSRLFRIKLNQGKFENIEEYQYEPKDDDGGISLNRVL
jgi:broad specificity phosphatase PhoE